MNLISYFMLHKNFLLLHFSLLSCNGYISPSYSTKSDVFSFGVIILEIVGGMKNREFHDPHYHLNLLRHVSLTSDFLWQIFKGVLVTHCASPSHNLKVCLGPTIFINPPHPSTLWECEEAKYYARSIFLFQMPQFY